MGIGVFLLPLILVKGSAILIGQPPQGAVATGGGAITVNSGVIEIFTPHWSLEQIAAMHRVEELREMSFGESPLLQARVISDIDPIDHTLSKTLYVTYLSISVPAVVT